MRAYVIRRLLLLVPTLFVLSVMVFLSVRFLPGDVIDVMLGRMEWQAAGGIDRAALERRLGLDVPVWVQYGRWMGGLFLRGSLGESLMGGWPIKERILGRLPVTAELGVLAIVIGLVIALPVGIYSAVRQYTAADYVGRSVAIMGLGDAQLLAGNDGDDLPGHLVGVVAADGVCFALRRPTVEPRHVPDPQPDPRHLPGGQHHAHDAHHDAGGAATGLYSARPGPRVCWSGR